MHLLVSTIALRPYVFVFLAVYLFVSIVNFGFRTTAIFTVLTYVVALACEWSSVHNGFPFGLYLYIPGHGGPGDMGVRRALYGFAVVHLPLLRQLHGRPDGGRADQVARAELAALRHPRDPPLAAGLDDGGAVHDDDRPGARSIVRAGRSMVFRQDLLVRPAGPAFRGADRQLPGMVLCGGGVSGALPIPGRAAGGGSRKPAGVIANLPLRWLLGPGLYLGIVGFAITMLFVVGAATIAWSAIFIFLPFLALIANTLTRPGSRATAADIARHLEDFPYDTEPAASCAPAMVAQRSPSSHLE